MTDKERITELETELLAERELREGDSKLIRALAEDAGIKITASDKLLGAQWEQFHDGVMKLAAEREKGQGAIHHMEACRALLNVPDDEVLYEAIKAERENRIEAERERDEFSKGCDNLAAKLSYERLKRIE
jgi:hypothetical protein